MHSKCGTESLDGRGLEWSRLPCVFQTKFFSLLFINLLRLRIQFLFNNLILLYIFSLLIPLFVAPLITLFYFLPKHHYLSCYLLQITCSWKLLVTNRKLLFFGCYLPQKVISSKSVGPKPIYFLDCYIPLAMNSSKLVVTKPNVPLLLVTYLWPRVPQSLWSPNQMFLFSLSLTSDHEFLKACGHQTKCPSLACHLPLTTSSSKLLVTKPNVPLLLVTYLWPRVPRSCWQLNLSARYASCPISWRASSPAPPETNEVFWIWEWDEHIAFSVPLFSWYEFQKSLQKRNSAFRSWFRAVRPRVVW
jgi:hypothetical protein